MAEGEIEAPLPPEKPRVSIKEELMPSPDGSGLNREAPRTKEGINYTAAFVMVAAGVATLAEVARAWKIPYDKLARKSTKENWAGLIKRYGHHFLPKLEQKPPDEAELKAKAAKIQANRDKIVTPAHALLDKIQKILDDNKELGMDTETIVDLARAVKMLGEITMVAVGDEHAVRHLMGGAPGSGRPGEGGHRGPLIQINMPGAVAGPRKVREIGAIVERAGKEIAAEAAEREEQEYLNEEEAPEIPAEVVDQ